MNIQVSEVYYQLWDKVHIRKVFEGIRRCRLRGRHRHEKVNLWILDDECKYPN